MPVFIIFSLCLSYLVQTDNPILTILVSPVIIYLGFACAIVAIIGIFLKKFQEKFCYDLFTSSALLIWFASWRPFFNDQSPMFFFFPLYFALITAFASFILINQRHQIDRQTDKYMRAFVEKSGMEPWILMIFILISLKLQHHFMLFPVFMTLLLVRFTLSGCLQPR